MVFRLQWVESRIKQITLFVSGISEVDYIVLYFAKVRKWETKEHLKPILGLETCSTPPGSARICMLYIGIIL